MDKDRRRELKSELLSLASQVKGENVLLLETEMAVDDVGVRVPHIDGLPDDGRFGITGTPPNLYSIEIPDENKFFVVIHPAEGTDIPAVLLDLNLAKGDFRKKIEDKRKEVTAIDSADSR